MSRTFHRGGVGGEASVKVGMVCPYDLSFPGGVQTHVAGLSRALRDKGVDVELIAPASGDEPGVFVPGGSFAVRANGSVARISFSPAAKARLKGRLSRGDLDLLHLHEPAIPSLSLLALMSSNIPAVATFHVSAERSLGYAAFKHLLGRWIGRLHSRIAVSEAARTLAERYFPGEYVVIPNGIETRRFAGASPDPFCTQHRPYVLFVGRAEPRKGLDLAVRAVEILRARRDVELVAVGPSPGDLPGWVVAPGSVENGRLPGFYAAADCFCAPSRGGESFGYVLIEAMASGVPVVCSAIPGYVEAAAGAAVHVPVDDPTSLADGIERVLDDPNFRKTLVSKGHARASELDWGVLSEKVLEQYRSALSFRT